MAAIQERPRLATFPEVWKLRDWRIGPKLLIAFLAAAIVPLALSGFLSIRASRDALLAQGIVNLSARNASTADAIDQFLVSHQEDASTFMTLSQLSTFVANPNDPTAKASALKILQSMTNRKYYESVAIADPRGTIILSSVQQDVNASIWSRSYFQQAMKDLNATSDVWVSPTTQQPTIYFSSPLLDTGGHVLGVLVSQVSFAGISDLVEKDADSVGTGTVGILLDENGIRIADSMSLKDRTAADKLLYTAVAPLPDTTVKQLVADKRFGNATAQTVAVTPLPEVAFALKNPGLKSFESSADDSSVRHYAAITALTAKPWSYVLMTPLPTFTGAADNLAVTFVLLMVVVAGITAIVVFFIARNFTAPIVHLTDVANRISMGELDTRIDIDRGDELGQLAEAIGRMQASLQATIERLRARRTGSQDKT
jgi:C4-dicarboxylate-specific signal transduction histidine kinase